MLHSTQRNLPAAAFGISSHPFLDPSSLTKVKEFKFGNSETVNMPRTILNIQKKLPFIYLHNTNPLEWSHRKRFGMSEFVESEAEESEDEDMDDSPVGIPQKKAKKLKAVDSDEDEEDDGEEVKDLIDDNPIEEDSDNESDGSRKRKKSDDEDDDDYDDRLEDEDYDLLEENLGVKVQRKKFKRLRRIEDEDSDNEESKDRGDVRETIANQLFEGSDAEEERAAPREQTEGHYPSEESEGEYSETDDFIVDDEGRPLTEKRRKTKKIFTDATLQEAQDIFGVDFDYDEFEKYDEEYYEDEEEEEEDEYEDEEQRSVRREKKQPRKKRKPKSIYEIYEPSELERAGFTDEDNKIRNQDIPERMQTRNVPISSATEEELEEEAEWIYKIAFSKREGQPNKKTEQKQPQASNAAGDGWGDDDWDAASTTQTKSQAPTTVGGDADWDEEDWDKPEEPAKPPPKVPDPVENWDDDDWDTAQKDAKKEDLKKPKTIPKIRKALEFMRNQHLEVPFIAFYRKEYVQPELSMNDLWKIYRLDAKFCQLWTRKSRLNILFASMREYQTDLILAKPDEPISDSMRLITDEDLERIKAIKTAEELKDVYLQFSLYYSEEVPSMKEAMERKKKEKRTAKRKNPEETQPPVDGEGGENEEPSEEPPQEPDEGDDDADKTEFPTIKRKVGGGAYGLCRKAGIDGFAKKFGLSPEKFAENLRDSYQRHEVEQYPSDPVELAKEYVSARLPTPEDVLKAAKFMVATQIAREPLVRHSVREVFFERATIHVMPTKKGMRELDEAHPIYSMKFLKEKPVRDLVGDQFLKLTIAQDDKLITMTVGEKIKGITADNYVEEVKALYNRDEFSDTVTSWNNLRFECVEFALEKLLYPVLKKELMAKLLDDSREHVLKACSYKLYNWIKMAPYEATFTEEDDEEWDTSKGLKVLALAYVPDLTVASFACYVGPDGDPSDYLRLQNIIKNSKSFREADREEKEADLAALKNFIRSKKPHVCVIGGESRDALMIQEDMRQICTELMQDDNFPVIKVEILDNQLAKIYANSIKATNDFREYPLLLRQAVSLGRRLQDPLIEFAQLCTADDEILCLRFHPLQEQVPKEDLLEYLHLEFVNRTNEVGVDIDRAITYPYTANLTQFICGLGPRKAVALIKTLKQNNQRLENRTQLITTCHMGPKIFINCSGFIKIDTNALGDSTDAYVEVLDGSRVHPETYEWARKMAVDALEYDDEDANPAGALEEILEAPERLKDLDLDAFADELERQGFGNKSITLYDIRNELNQRYDDLRTKYAAPNSEEMFNMLTKETPETLYIGKLVTAQVVTISHKKPQGEQLDNAIPVRNEETGMWQCAFCMKNDFPDLSEVWNHFDAGACPGQATGVRIRLDNGISGFVPITKLSDKQVTNPENRVKKGQTIHCRIVKIDVERFSVECTSRTSDLVDAKHEWRPAKDVYYDQELEDKFVKKDEDVKKLKQRQTYIKRVIVHPSFKNISYQESEKLMEQMDQGEVIVRPSSKGADHLTVTWKVTDGVYQHIDVREEGKENAFSLGQSLWIGNEAFEDLDEIIARHVNPMASYARDVLNFRYYNALNGGNKQQAEEFLYEERKKNANKIHYVLHATKDYPGKFFLSYLPRHKVAHELMTITPDGFRFRQQSFDSLSQCFKWFKEHYRDPPPSATPTSTPRAHQARTPFATPGYADAISRVAQPPSQFGMNSAATAHTTPHYTTPAQAFTPYSAFTSHTPYTPTAQTPYMTPYQTPFQNVGTPRFPTQQPQVGGSSGFLHPGTITPGYKTPQQRPQQERIVNKNNNNGNTSNESLDWRKAAEAWAKSQQKGQNPAWSTVQSRVGGAQTGTSQQHRVPYGTPSQFNAPGGSRGPPKSPATAAAQVINEGIQKIKQMSSSALNYIAHKSPRSGRESLRSTPRTNFSPRSMVESSLGDETPLYDET